jgi:hypothetical protein
LEIYSVDDAEDVDALDSTGLVSAGLSLELSFAAGLDPAVELECLLP